MNSSDRNKRILINVKMEVTPSQALALTAMFEYWNQLGSQGASRNVAFRCDGDGNFRPHCEVTTDQSDNWPLPMLTDDMRRKAVVREDGGNRVYDFDPVAWMLHDELE